ncbi:MAG TPA: MFS transporter [Acidobacteriota bacterium]|nr:MFS transporter [Acidobacteriota bacterium]
MPDAKSGPSSRHIVLSLIAVFSIIFTVSFFIQQLAIARPRMAADLDGMALYSWSLSIPSLAAAFVTLLFSKFSDMYGRRIMLIVSMIIYIAGTILSALSPTFVFLIAANTLSRVGNGALMPLCYSVLGDMYAPAERSKWIGLLNIPQGICALCGPTLGGWMVDHYSWRHIYWMGVPLLVFCLIMVPFGIPRTAKRLARKIDLRGAVLVFIASSLSIIGISLTDTYPWASVQVLGMLGGALISWILFFRAETEADEPILDPQVFRNRTFLTVAVSSLMSFIGLMGMMMYFPFLLQGVQGISVMRSGLIMTPYSVLVAFIGVFTGFLLAKTKRYKWMYISGYGLVTAVLFGIVSFDASTPVLWSVIAGTLAGLGLGAVPTVNTLVVQCAVPKRLLGASMGAIFFSITIGMAISPAILGAAMNVSYAKKLEASLPAGLHQVADKTTMASLGDPKVLLSPKAMKTLEDTFNRTGPGGAELFKQTVDAIRSSMEAGLQSVFLLGAITMLLAFLLILTVPEVSMDAVVEDKKPPVAAAEESSA